MDSIETLIPDNEGNHLVVVLSFYDETDKFETFKIPCEFVDIDIADISIAKLNQHSPINIKVFFSMCNWLFDQFLCYPNAVFSFICSTDPLDTRHNGIQPELYRWRLFESFYLRNHTKLAKSGINTQSVIVGPEEYQTFARVFYRGKHSATIHFVIDHLVNKYS